MVTLTLSRREDHEDAASDLWTSILPHVYSAVQRHIQQLNAQSLYHGLPEDILFIIMGFLELDDRLSAAQVCHHWKTAASKALLVVDPWEPADAWSVVEHHHKLRFLDAPLVIYDCIFWDDINYVEDPDEYQKAVKALGDMFIERMPRIRLLNINFPTKPPLTYHYPLLKALTARAPTLRTLEIETFPSHAFNRFLDDHHETWTWFGGAAGAPLLQRVALRGEIPRDPTVCGLAKTLLICTYGEPLSFAQFGTLLHERLENLFLFPNNDPVNEGHATSRHVLPPRLKRLWIKIPTPALDWIDHSDLPFMCVTVGWKGPSTWMRDIAQLCPFSPTHVDVDVEGKSGFIEDIVYSFRVVGPCGRERLFSGSYKAEAGDDIFTLPSTAWPAPHSVTLRELFYFKRPIILDSTVTQLDIVLGFRFTYGEEETASVSFDIPQITCPSLTALTLTVLPIVRAHPSTPERPCTPRASDIAACLSQRLSYRGKLRSLTVRGVLVEQDAPEVESLASEITWDHRDCELPNWTSLFNDWDTWKRF